MVAMLQDTMHTQVMHDQTDKGAGLVEVAPGKFMAPGRTLSKQEAMDRTFDKDREVLRRLAK